MTFNAAASLALSRAVLANTRRVLLASLLLALVVLLRLVGVRMTWWGYVALLAWPATGAVYWAVLRGGAARTSGGGDDHGGSPGRGDHGGSPLLAPDTVSAVAYCGDATLLTVICTGLGGGWWLGPIYFAFVANFAFMSLPRRRAQLVLAYTVVAYLVFLGLQATGITASGESGLGLPSLHGDAPLTAAVALLGTAALLVSAWTQSAFVVLMRRAQERFRVVLRAVPDAIITTDRAGVVVSANDTARAYVAPARPASAGEAGRPSGDVPLVGQHVSVFAHPDDREEMAAAVTAAAGGEGTTRAIRGPAASPPDVERCFVVSCNPIREDDRITGVLVVARDDTARRRDEQALRRSEEQLRQAQKMEATGRLAGGVAHDFNNLLTVIGTYVELLEHGVSPGSSQARDIDGIRAAATRATALTNQLLAFSRKAVLQPRLLNLNDTVGAMEQMLRRLIPAGVRIETRLFPGLSATRADPGQMEQVIVNLAVNARDAMPDGGVLTIETDNVFLDPEFAHVQGGIRPGPHVLLSVSDTGEGMDDETRARIFEPFFTTKATGKGTGLGLATVYGIVRQSGGHIVVQTALGEGTTFRIYFPVATTPAAASPAAPVTASGSAPPPARPAVPVAARPAAPVAVPAVAGGRGETLLLVEDGEALREVLARVLDDTGYRVLVASDGAEGLAVSDRHAGPIHLVITDVVMPNMGGREMAARLWESRPETRVLFMSGYAEDAILRQGIRGASVPFIGKPFRPDALLRRIREVLDERKPDERTEPERALPEPGATRPAGAS